MTSASHADHKSIVWLDLQDEPRGGPNGEFAANIGPARARAGVIGVRRVCVVHQSSTRILDIAARQARQVASALHACCLPLVTPSVTCFEALLLLRRA